VEVHALRSSAAGMVLLLAHPCLGQTAADSCQAWWPCPANKQTLTKVSGSGINPSPADYNIEFLLLLPPAVDVAMFAGKGNTPTTQASLCTRAVTHG
jgi:hypothetical protein